MDDSNTSYFQSEKAQKNKSAVGEDGKSPVSKDKVNDVVRNSYQKQIIYPTINRARFFFLSTLFRLSST